MLFKNSIVVLTIFIIFTNPVKANVVASSNFETGVDGWSWDPLNEAPFSWELSGGYLGSGYIRFDDNLHTNQAIAFMFAPTKFLGDWITKGVTELTFQQNVFSTGGIASTGTYFVGISGPEGEATWRGSLIDANTPWKKITVPIDEASWSIVSGSWDALIADVTHLEIPGELYESTTPAEITGIDNISLNAVPIPAALPLFFTGVIGLFTLYRRKTN